MFKKKKKKEEGKILQELKFSLMTCIGSARSSVADDVTVFVLTGSKSHFQQGTWEDGGKAFRCAPFQDGKLACRCRRAACVFANEVRGTRSRQPGRSCREWEHQQMELKEKA